MASSPPVRVSDAPAQTGPLFAAVTIGLAFTVAVVVAVSLHPLESVIINVYNPVIADVAEATVGF